MRKCKCGENGLGSEWRWKFGITMQGIRMGLQDGDKWRELPGNRWLQKMFTGMRLLKLGVGQVASNTLWMTKWQDDFKWRTFLRAEHPSLLLNNNVIYLVSRYHRLRTRELWTYENAILVLCGTIYSFVPRATLKHFKEL